VVQLTVCLTLGDPNEDGAALSNFDRGLRGAYSKTR
jgi:hypothetical protein